MHSSISERMLRQTALWVGLASLATGIGMAFEYGRAMSMLHAVGLGLLAIAVSIAFVASEMYRNIGRNTAARVALVVGVAFSAGEYGTHFGYTFGSRLTDTQQTVVQNARYDGAQQATKEDRANFELWTKQLATLLEKDAWTATVQASALRDELDVIKGRMAKEESGKRGRKAGKGSVYEKLENQAIEIGLKIAKVEQRESLEKSIEATKRKLDETRTAAAKTEFKSSKITNQAVGFAQLVTLDDKPSESAISWVQLVLGAIIAAITTYLAPFCLSVAFSGSGKKVTPSNVTARESYSLNMPPVEVDRLPQPRNMAGNTDISINETYITRQVDDGKIEDLRRRMAQALRTSGERLAAA